MKQFTITRTFDAPRAEVWRAWTDPSVAARWWHPGGMETKGDNVTIDLREGGSYSYTMVGPDGSEYPTTGRYLEVREPERLRFTWAAPVWSWTTPRSSPSTSPSRARGALR